MPHSGQYIGRRGFTQHMRIWQHGICNNLNGTCWLLGFIVSGGVGWRDRDRGDCGEQIEFHLHVLPTIGATIGLALVIVPNAINYAPSGLGSGRA